MTKRFWGSATCLILVFALSGCISFTTASFDDLLDYLGALNDAYGAVFAAGAALDDGDAEAAEAALQDLDEIFAFMQELAAGQPIPLQLLNEWRAALADILARLRSGDLNGADEAFNQLVPALAAGMPPPAGLACQGNLGIPRPGSSYTSLTTYFNDLSPVIQTLNAAQDQIASGDTDSLLAELQQMIADLNAMPSDHPARLNFLDSIVAVQEAASAGDLDAAQEAISQAVQPFQQCALEAEQNSAPITTETATQVQPQPPIPLVSENAPADSYIFNFDMAQNVPIIGITAHLGQNGAFETTLRPHNFAASQLATDNVTTLSDSVTGKMAVSPSGQHLAAVIENGDLVIYDRVTGQRIQTLSESATTWQNDTAKRQPTTAAHQALQADIQLYSLAFSPDEKQLAVGYGDGSVTVWDIATNTPLWTAQASNPTVFDLNYSPDGTLISAVAAASPAVTLFDAATGTVHATLEHDAFAIRATFSRNGELVAVGNAAGGIAIWSLEALQPIIEFAGSDTVEVCWLDFGVDNRVLLAGSCRGTPRLYDAFNGTELANLNPAGDNFYFFTQFDPSGSRIVAVDSVNQLASWAVDPNAEPANQSPTTPAPPASGCQITALDRVNLRGGPGTTFDVQGQLEAGTSGAVSVGMLGTDGQIWWNLQAGGWVRADLVTATGCEGLQP